MKYGCRPAEPARPPLPESGPVFAPWGAALLGRAIPCFRRSLMAACPNLAKAPMTESIWLAMRVIAGFAVPSWRQGSARFRLIDSGS